MQKQAAREHTRQHVRARDCSSGQVAVHGQHAYVQDDFQNGQDDHRAIKQIEAVRNVFKEAQGKQLEDHLCGEEAGEYVVADGQSLSVCIRHACRYMHHLQRLLRQSMYQIEFVVVMVRSI